MDEVRFAFLGAGMMAKAHSLALATLPIYAWPPPAMPVRQVIAGSSPERGDEAATRFGFARSASDWRSAVEDPQVDAVAVLLPNALHGDAVLAAAAAGKHVLCEKPIASSSAEAREMVAAVERAGIVNQTAFNWRLAPAVLLARRLLDDGTIGAVRDFRGYWMSDFGTDPAGPLGFRFDTSGRGALSDLGSHVIDYARFLVGEIAEVAAVDRTYIHARPLLGGDGTGPVEVADAAMALVQFEGGAYGSFHASWASPGRKTFAGFEIHGDDGALSFTWERMSEIRVYDRRDAADRQGYRTVMPAVPHPYGELFWLLGGYQIGFAETKVIQMHQLLAAIAGGPPVMTDLRDGLRNLLVEEAIDRAARTRAWTAVEPV